MFTQCPECRTTFRVNAKVLQQAAGRVRCGGCQHAFNALEHLSQDDEPGAKPEAKGKRKAADRQNKELLETLDRLAGSEVTLEDTGVEWRVIDEGQDDDSPTATHEAERGDTGSMRFVVEDETGDRTRTKLSLHGRRDDLPQPVPDNQQALDLPGAESTAALSDEQRYDDNTVLPEDFGSGPASIKPRYPDDYRTPRRRAADREAAEDRSAFDKAQADLALGEPDDWVELLDEVNGEDEPIETQPSVTPVPPAADEPLVGDMPSDIDTQFDVQAEDMGLDTGSHEIIEDDVPDEVGEELTLVDDSVTERKATGEFGPDVEVATSAPADGDARKDAADAPAREEKTASAPTMLGGRDVSHYFDEDSQVVETIIMEGDTVRDALQEERRKSVLPPHDLDALDSPASLVDTYALNRGKIRGGRRSSDPPSYTVIASVFVLGFVLIAQILHQSRESLATYGAFNHTIGPIYRAIGKPVTPGWDIKGWQFEATNGSVDENEELLTIYSRIANESTHALPYPLVHVALTDRWEDIIGSRILEPTEYLAGDLDPSKPVSAGANFTAVITIQSPSAEATGFKLNVCYRVSPGRVRCATEDFKD